MSPAPKKGSRTAHAPSSPPRARSKNKIVVTVFPMTHSPPFEHRDAVELPAALKKHLGLDDERSWVVVTEFTASSGRASICSRAPA
jgi:hypothetical protein